MKKLRAKLRRFLIGHRLVPKSALARFTLWTAGLWLLFFLLWQVLPAKSGWATFFEVWAGLCKFLTYVLVIILALRWIRRNMMWRLRNKLLVTYLFIGLIPALMIVVMAAGASYIFAGQYATYIASKELETELQHVKNAASLNLSLLQRDMERGTAPEQAVTAVRGIVEQQGLDSEQMAAYIDGREYPLRGPSIASELPQWIADGTFGPINVGTNLFLLSSQQRAVGKHHLIVVARVPVDHEFLDRVSASIGEITVLSTGATRKRTKKNDIGFETQDGKNGKVDIDDRDANPTATGGNLAPARFRGDIIVIFGAPFQGRDWSDGANHPNAIAVRTRPSLLYDRLFSVSSDFAPQVLRLLGFVAILFGIIVLIALLIGVRITRTITGAIHKLYRATQHVNRGDFSHRITVTSKDQLAALESSFNSMTESVERLLIEQKQKERLENELAIAQEVQNQLFPRSATGLASLELHGICRPARTVSGDYYDFIPFSNEQLVLAVGDISGKGISAALLMATIHSAVRAYEFGRVAQPLELATAGSMGPGKSYADSAPGSDSSNHSTAEVMWLLNRHLYRSTPMEKYATMFLGLYDGRSRTLSYSNAGHLPPLLVDARGHVRRLEHGGTVIGLFEDVRYDEARVEMNPGEIFVAFSDGITEPENEFGEFGEERLIDLIQENHDLPLARISEIVTTAVQDWIGGAEQPDDVTLVLARAI